MQTVRRSRLMRVGLALLTCWLTIGMAGAVAAEPEYQLLEAFGPDGTESTGFAGAGSIALDHQGSFVYVIDRAGSLFKFDTSGQAVNFGGTSSYILGNEISGLSFNPSAGEAQVAVDSGSHVVYVTSANAVRAFEANGEPHEFTAGPGTGTSEITGFTELIGVATDASGNIYASDYGPGGSGVISVFAASGELITSFETLEPANLAVDGNGAVYVVRWHSTVLKFVPDIFPVTPGTLYTAEPQPLNDKETYSVAIDPSTNDVYVAQGFLEPKVVVYDENGVLVGHFAGSGEEGAITSSEGVGVDPDTGRIFVANIPSTGLSQVKVFGPRTFFEGLPSVEGTAVNDVTGDSATLWARVNPNMAETTYYFEVGLQDCSISTCTRVPLDSASIGGGHEVRVVSQEIAGLQVGTTYHYRVVAANSFGTTEGADRVFTTEIAAIGFRLGDSRVWEMVSPSNKRGALLIGTAVGQIQAAADGNGLAYLSGGSIESDPDGSRTAEVSSVLARRGAGGGWISKDITPPNARVIPLGVGLQGEYKLFSTDLAKGLLEPRDGTNLSSEASERTPYLRENTEPPSYRPLVTSKEGFANVSPETEFGGGDFPRGSVQIQGATVDLDYVVLTSAVPLFAGAAAPGLYEWADGELRVVSILPAAEGGAMVASNLLGSGPVSVRNAISQDGSRVYWTAQGSGGLYMRDTVVEETVRIDVPQPDASEAGDVAPKFQGASSDGSAVFFTDSRQLTVDASPAGRDLYRCEVPAGTPTGCDSLVDLTPPAEGSGESAEVQGVVPSISDDGSKAYFVAKGILDAGLNDAGQAPTAGESNLYLWEEGEGLRFIATLSPGDRAVWGMPGTVPGFASAVGAASSPSGRFFAFMSERSLTGADNLNPVSGDPVEQLFRYDAVTGALQCVSCDPTGAAPGGRTIDSNSGLIDPQSQWEGQQVAAVLPEPTVIEASGNSIYRPRAVLDNGRVFFNGADPLVIADTNDEWDVYQYEDLGLGSCDGSSKSTESASGEGCIALLSSGSAERAAGFLDASVSGDDVFFLTPARLSVADTDDEYDVYDARVNGEPAVLEPRYECLGQACRPAGTQGTKPNPASAGFNGAGNLKAGRKCPKGKRKVQRKGRTRCVVRKHGKHRKRAGQRAGSAR
jgi:hypothetical protein